MVNALRVNLKINETMVHLANRTVPSSETVVSAIRRSVQLEKKTSQFDKRKHYSFTLKHEL